VPVGLPRPDNLPISAEPPEYMEKHVEEWIAKLRWAGLSREQISERFRRVLSRHYEETRGDPGETDPVR